MSLAHLARRPPAWLRVALAALLLVFALDSVAHVTHRHDDSAVTMGMHGPACSYCAAFDGVVDAPRYVHAPLTATIIATYVAPVEQLPFAVRTYLSAQPRAPPTY